MAIFNVALCCNLSISVDFSMNSIHFYQIFGLHRNEIWNFIGRINKCMVFFTVASFSIQMCVLFIGTNADIKIHFDSKATVNDIYNVADKNCDRKNIPIMCNSNFRITASIRAQLCIGCAIQRLFETPQFECGKREICRLQQYFKPTIRKTGIICGVLLLIYRMRTKKNRKSERVMNTASEKNFICRALQIGTNESAAV